MNDLLDWFRELTLVEWLIIAAIAAILLAVIIPNVMTTRAPSVDPVEATSPIRFSAGQGDSDAWDLYMTGCLTRNISVDSCAGMADQALLHRRARTGRP